MAAGSHGRRKSAARVRVAPLYGARSAAALNAARGGPDRAGATQPHSFGPSAQLGERRDGIAEAASSNLARSTNPGLVAQRESTPFASGRREFEFSSGPPMGQAAGCRYPLQGCRRGFDSHLLHQSLACNHWLVAQRQNAALLTRTLQVRILPSQPITRRSSSGLGPQPLKLVIAGSNPARRTISKRADCGPPNGDMSARNLKQFRDVLLAARHLRSQRSNMGSSSIRPTNFLT